MQCNIDRRGQLVRLWIGVFSIVCGIVLTIVVIAVDWSPWLHLLAAFMVASGAFAVFEARKKWCAARAMGFRTPI